MRTTETGWFLLMLIRLLHGSSTVLMNRDVKTRLIDSQPDAAGPSTLGGNKGVDVSKDSKNESSGGCC